MGKAAVFGALPNPGCHPSGILGTGDLSLSRIFTAMQQNGTGFILGRGARARR